MTDLTALRPEFVDGAAACRAATLNPATDHGLSPDLRAALAHRMALANDDGALAAEFPVATGYDGLANGATDLPEPLATIARHADLVTRTPALATPDHIRALERAGLTNPQIVALSELIAFVNFQTRVNAGLRLMGAA